MNLPKLVIFDMDGLIFDTERLFMNKKAAVLEAYGYEAKESDYIQTVGLAGKQLNDKLFEIYGFDYPALEISHKTREIVNEHMEKNGPDVKPGIRELLKWLQTQKVKCCVASSTQSQYVKKYLKMANLDEYFDFVVGGEMVEHSKPNPDIFLLACERAKQSPENALVFEDSENGIRASYAAHIPVICVPDLKYPSEEIEKMCYGICKRADDAIEYLNCYEQN